MKTKFTILFAMFCATIMAQDVIITKESLRIDAKIEEVSAEQIKYRKANNPNGPLFIMPTNEIQAVMYENGDVQIFETSENKSKNKVARSDKQTKSPKERKEHKSISVKRWFGITVGWVLRDRVQKVDEMPLTDNSGNILTTLSNYKSQSLGNTLQIGFTFAPSFGKYGLGFYTGIYFEHTWAMKQVHTWDPIYSSAGSELETGKVVIEDEPVYDGHRVKWFGNFENQLYLPIHFQYKYDFNPNVNLYASVGPSFEFGLGKVNYYSSSSFDYYTNSKINILMGGRVGFQLYGAQISVTSDWGISHETYYDISSRYHRPISIQISYMF